jgi:hypothetical protein
MEFDFIDAFYHKIADKQIDWEVSGLVASDGRIFSYRK